MKRKIAALTATACLLTVNCFGAVTDVSKDYSIDTTTVTVKGTASKGDTIGYTVVKKGADAKVKANVLAVGEIEATADNGSFSIDFTMPDTTPTDDYTVYVGWLGGSATKSVDVHFVNISGTVTALKAAETLDDLKTIFAPAEEHKEALTQLGMDYTILNSLSGKDDTLTAFLNDEGRADADPATLAQIFNKHMGYRMINEKKTGGLAKINPSFGDPAVKYNDLTDTALKTYLDSGIYSKTYSGLDDVYDKYEELNIIYLINSCDAGELKTLVAEYYDELGLSGKSYYTTYTDFIPSKKDTVGSKYLGFASGETVNSAEKFREIFEKAVKAANKGTGGGGGTGTGGGSGSGSGGGAYVPNSSGSLSINNERFDDLAGFDWAYEPINALADKGIINGVSSGKFAPADNVTREQMVKMLLLSIGEDGAAVNVPFTDVDFAEWYAPYVARSYELGLVNGISETLFGTGDNITRQDLAVIAVRAAKYKGIIKEEKAEASPFGDREQIADYAKDAVDTLYSLSIIGGKDGNVFAPEDNCTRAEAAKIIYNTFFK